MIDRRERRDRARRVLLACLVSGVLCVATGTLCVSVLGMSFSDAVGVAGIALAIVGIPLNLYAAMSPPVPESTTAPHAAPAHRPGQLIVGDVPAEAAALQPRAALVDRLAARRRDGAAGVVTAITGLRGVGKTQLAAAYARAAVTDAWPVVVWVTAQTPDQIVAGLARLADAAQVRPPDSDTATAAEAALAWLRVQPGPCLLVYDNAEDPDQLRPWIPGVGNVQVIITAVREAFAALGSSIPVELFTTDEARTYLRDRTGVDDPDGADRLATALGWLPLALAQAAALIGRHRAYSGYAEFLDRLDSMPVTEALQRVVGDTYTVGAARTMQLSFDALGPDDGDGTVTTVLNRFAVLAPTGVTANLLTMPGHGDHDVRVALGQLLDRALVAPSADGRSFGQHRLVQRVRREQLAAAGQLDGVLSDVAGVVAAALTPIEEAWQHRTESGPLVDHILALWNSADSTANHATPPADLAAALLELRVWAVAQLNRTYDHTRAIALGIELVADADRILGAERPTTLAARMGLAAAYRSMGRLDDAIPLYETALEGGVRVLGTDHPDTLQTRNNLAGAYQSVGRLDEAIALYESTLDDRARVLGPEHPDTLQSRNNLAGAYRAARRLVQAIALYESTLADRIRILGPDDPDTLTSRNNLAGAYQSARRHDEAIGLYESTLADRERILGPEHPTTLQSRNNLAGAYRSANRLDEAIPLYQSTLAHRERILGPDHLEALTSRSNLAAAYRSAGRFDEAIGLYESIVADRERILGPDHPSTLQERNNLARAVRAAGRHDEGIGLLEATLADQRRILGPGHPDTLQSTNNLAYAYQSAGRLDDAVALYEATLVECERLLGPNHATAEAVRRQLAHARDEQAKAPTR
jgi:tetratricopeptide (TPR) repeat protein